MSNVPAPTTGQDVAVPGSGLPDGLDDIDQSDLTLPIYKIDHNNGTFVNGLTNEAFTEFNAILLGVIKQRILWPRDPGSDGEAPMCRSYDFSTGIPRAETWVQPQKNNPQHTAVRLSGFSFDMVEAAAEGSGLACANCALKEWGENRTPPWCNEQWTFPFARITPGGEPTLGVISFQKTALKTCKPYVTSFVQAKSALYTVETKIRAVVQSRGNVEWVTPSFQRVGDTDSVKWPELSATYHQVRDYLTTPRVMTSVDPDEDDVAAATQQTATASRPAPAPVSPTRMTPAPESVPPAAAPEPHTPTQATTDVTEQPPTPARRAQPAAVPDDFGEEEPF